MSLRATHMQTAPFPFVGTAGGGSTPPTPANLTAIYPYQTVQVNAKNFWLPSLISANSPSFSYLTIPPNNMAVPTIRFSQSSDFSVNSMIGFYLCFNRSELDVANPSIKITLNWLNFDTTPAPSPTRYVKFNAGIVGMAKNTNNWYPATYADSLTAPVRDRYILNGGNVASIENTLEISTLSGSLSASNSNLINFVIIRDNSVADNYAGYAYLLGVTVQYKTDFANVAEWSV